MRLPSLRWSEPTVTPADDEVLAAVEGLDAEGEQARTELAEFMEGLEKQALRFEDKRDTLKARMAKG